MSRAPEPSLEEELERRLALLSRGEPIDRRLPPADTLALAAITVGSFVLAISAQAL